MMKHALWMATLIILAMICAPVAMDARIAYGESAAAESDGATEDVLVLDSGKEVRGQIIEETPTEIVMVVEFRGISTRTTYLVSEVLEIKRDLPTETPAAGDHDEERDAPNPGAIGRDDDDDTNERPDWVNEDTALLYVAELEGFMGFDVTDTPLVDLFKDVDRHFDDLVQVPGAEEMQVQQSKRRQNIVVLRMDCRTNPAAGFDGLFVAEQMAPTIMREREKGRRIVFWVENAGGGAAFLAFTSPEIYMTRDGWMGGVGTLDDFDIGDDLVNEKQISLRLGHAEGLALYGGYGEVGVKIVRAMTRKQFWFAARLVGGQPEVILENPMENPDIHGVGWTVLSDDGKGSNKDDKHALRGNDVLVLEADWAQKLGMSQGVADTVDELAFALGVERNYYELPETRAEKIMEGWSDEVDHVLRQINVRDDRPLGDLWVKFNDVNKYAKTPAQAIGQKIKILKQIHSIIGRYAEVFDRSAGWRGNIELQIEQLRQEAERLRRREAQRRSRSNQR